jgi:quercetin dioxygenase-like cupin family protein
MTTLRVFLATASMLVALMFCVPAAFATPGRGLESRLLDQSALSGIAYITREITIAPGGSTGWHWHDGKLIGVIKQGTLTHNIADCSLDGVYHIGDPIVEPAGAAHVHIGRNLGNDPVILQVLYVDPIGKPLFEDAPDPGCPFS